MDHYDGIREMSGIDVGGLEIVLLPSGPITGMNSVGCLPHLCPTCGGTTQVKVQSGFGDVNYYNCGDCQATGCRSVYVNVLKTRLHKQRVVNLCLFGVILAFAALFYIVLH